MLPSHRQVAIIAASRRSRSLANASSESSSSVASSIRALASSIASDSSSSIALISLKKSRSLAFSRSLRLTSNLRIVPARASSTKMRYWNLFHGNDAAMAMGAAKDASRACPSIKPRRPVPATVVTSPVRVDIRRILNARTSATRRSPPSSKLIPMALLNLALEKVPSTSPSSSLDPAKLITSLVRGSILRMLYSPLRLPT
mmetsp:Transcript_1742/g.2514  ORF Transcript_1742/g.2514 Transcript_1742/m.2514 type:complete len:201 (+) Transcript_1742:273-875(+)